MKISIIEVEKLIPSTYNPRLDLQVGDSEYNKLKNSIETFGYIEPIIWNERTGNVVGGHQRLKILIEQGYKEIECSVVDLSIDNEKALNIALNKISGDWDNEKLAELLQELTLADFDIALSGFDTKEIEKLVDTAFSENLIEDYYEVDNIEDEKALTKTGDIWQLGRHRLICGDSTKSEDIKNLMQCELADLILTDPPYNVDYHSSSDKSIMNDKLSADEFYNFLKESFANGDDFLKNGGAFYLWHSDKISNTTRNVCSDIGWEVRQCLIWNKSMFILGQQDYQWKHESCLYGWKDGASHYFSPIRNNTTVIEFPKPQRSIEHPTMKPVGLFGELINNSTRVNEVVLDLFGGSGTTIIACEQLKRSARVIEIDPKFCDVIVKRFIDFNSNEKIYLNNKEYKKNT